MFARSLTLAAAATVVLSAVSMGPVTVAAAQGDDVVKKYDKDQDKTLDIAEVRAAASAHFDQLNKDLDHTLEVEEVKGIIGERTFKEADVDKDGTLSRDEYLSLVEKLFRKADADKDGTLTASEMQSKAGQMLRRLID